jgi:hypothetical protein
MIRRFMEFLPPVCIAAGLGGAAVAERLALVIARLRFARKWTPLHVEGIGALSVAALLFSPVIYWNVHNHPHQLVLQRAGGRTGAQRLNLGEHSCWASRRGAIRRSTPMWTERRVTAPSDMYVACPAWLRGASGSSTRKPAI